MGITSLDPGALSCLPWNKVKLAKSVGEKIKVCDLPAPFLLLLAYKNEFKASNLSVTDRVIAPNACLKVAWASYDHF
jgi:hypothetical protein